MCLHACHMDYIQLHIIEPLFACICISFLMYYQVTAGSSVIVMPAPASVTTAVDNDEYSEENFETDNQALAAVSTTEQQQQQQQHLNDDIWQSLGTSSAATAFKSAATAPHTTVAACSSAVVVVLASTDITHEQWHEFGQRIGTSVVANISKRNTNPSQPHSTSAAVAAIVLPVPLHAIAVWLDTVIAPWCIAAQAITLTADGPSRKNITACTNSITATCSSSSSSKAATQQQPGSVSVTKASLVLRGFYTATTSANSSSVHAVGSKQHEQLSTVYSELVPSINKLTIALSTQLTDTNVDGSERLQAIDTMLKAIGLVAYADVNVVQHLPKESSSKQQSQVYV
jgi:hypothetical protein